MKNLLSHFREEYCFCTKLHFTEDLLTVLDGNSVLYSEASQQPISGGLWY